MDFVKASLEYLSPNTLGPFRGLSLQIGKLQELWSPIELIARLLAVIALERLTSEFAEMAHCLSVVQYARARIGERELLCANWKLISWVLSVRPEKVFAVTAVFDYGMFEHMKRMAVDMLRTAEHQCAVVYEAVLTWRC